MARWLYLVYSSCVDPSREAEFNEWYDRVHVPDVLTTRGFLRAWRFENQTPAPGQGKFVAAYDIESDDVDTTLATLSQNVALWRKQGRHSPLIQVTGRALYRLITPAQARTQQ